VQGRYLSKVLGQDSHVWLLSKGKNKSRNKPTRVRRALGSPEHARRPPPRASRRAKAEPAPLAATAPIKPPRDFEHTPPRALDLTGAPDHRRCPAHGVPAATQTPATVDRPAEPLPAASDPRSRPCMPR
jgi:hypothetical protein